MERKELIQKAINAMSQAYAPYSKFHVGCSLLMKDNTVITGANIENASYGLSNCAERSALFAAYSQGYRQNDIVSMVVVGDTDSVISPCGACRQVISELVNADTEIILTNLKQDVKIVNKFELLPFGFTDKDMEK
ncbi:cytidine deaminase [Mycoplasmatota bacterium]|nr:cytidine deaminase [Mycoplasmatota bacterium]